MPCQLGGYRVKLDELPECWNGRQAVFRTLYPQGCGGSSPLSGTKGREVYPELVEGSPLSGTKSNLELVEMI